jgi:hypothetical protein
MPHPTSKPWKKRIYLIAVQATLRLAEVEAVLLSKQEAPQLIVPELKKDHVNEVQPIQPPQCLRNCIIAYRMHNARQWWK